MAAAGSVPGTSPAVARLVVLIVANALLRIAGGASGILVGLYLSDAASRGVAVDAGLVGLNSRTRRMVWSSLESKKHHLSGRSAAW